MLSKEKNPVEEMIDDVIKILATKTKVEDLVNNYKNFLENEHPNHVRSYSDRLRNQPASARAEAVTFHFFRSNLDEVQVNEVPNKGGVDFLCKTGTSEFIAEITCLESESVTRRSGLKYEPTENPSVGTFSPITRKLCDTVCGKASQMSGYEIPGMLVIACEHPQADLLFDSFDAQRLLVGDIKIGFSIPNNGKGVNSITELENSCFLRWNQGWELTNRSISSILLFHTSGASAFVLGILHPDPVHKFPPNLLPSIPFARLKQWPPKGGNFKIEWVKYEKTELVALPEPEQHRFWYDLSLRNNETTTDAEIFNSDDV